MDQVRVIAALQRHKNELRQLGIMGLSLFGSTARGDAAQASDVDIAVTLLPGPRGFAHLERMDCIKARLGSIVGCPVDVIEEPAPSPSLQRAIDQDRILAL